MKILFLFLIVFSLAACSDKSVLVNYNLPERPPSCTDHPKKLSEKNVKRDLHIVEAAEWHIDDRITYAKERAKWLDCKRFLRRTWKNMQSKK